MILTYLPLPTTIHLETLQRSTESSRADFPASLHLLSHHTSTSLLDVIATSEVVALWVHEHYSGWDDVMTFVAGRFGFLGVVKRCLDEGGEVGEVGEVAAEEGWIEIVQMCVERGRGMKGGRVWMMRAVRWAERRGWREVVEYLRGVMLEEGGEVEFGGCKVMDVRMGCLVGAGVQGLDVIRACLEGC
ncbi:hypothetical protein BC829DRAFT_396892 [Chytridium lagenaria]|nr:hypothetical protein BC829DRAFT_396892 [Chytridium lagenaria]